MTAPPLAGPSRRDPADRDARRLALRGLVTMGGWAVVTGIVHALRVTIALRARPRTEVRR